MNNSRVVHEFEYYVVDNLFMKFAGKGDYLE